MARTPAQPWRDNIAEEIVKHFPHKANLPPDWLMAAADRFGHMGRNRVHKLWLDAALPFATWKAAAKYAYMAPKQDDKESGPTHFRRVGSHYSGDESYPVWDIGNAIIDNEENHSRLHSKGRFNVGVALGDGRAELKIGKRRGHFKRIAGIDISEPYLKDCEHEMEMAGIPFDYFPLDFTDPQTWSGDGWKEITKGNKKEDLPISLTALGVVFGDDDLNPILAVFKKWCENLKKGEYKKNPLTGEWEFTGDIIYMEFDSTLIKELVYAAYNTADFDAWHRRQLEFMCFNAKLEGLEPEKISFKTVVEQNDHGLSVVNYLVFDDDHPDLKFAGGSTQAAREVFSKNPLPSVPVAGKKMQMLQSTKYDEKFLIGKLLKVAQKHGVSILPRPPVADNSHDLSANDNESYDLLRPSKDHPLRKKGFNQYIAAFAKFAA